MPSFRFPATLACVLVLPAIAAAQGRTDSTGAKPRADTAGYAAMTPATQEFVRMAASGAPAQLADQAAIGRIESDGSLTILRPGTNGFTCTLLPLEGNPPICADSAATQWTLDMVAGKPSPTNTKPGFAYMAKGGSHYETADGRSLMKNETGARTVEEPPHWMIMWPVDTASGLPTKPNAGGTYIMFAGTPYAHLMVYQDPKLLERK